MQCSGGVSVGLCLGKLFSVVELSGITGNALDDKLNVLIQPHSLFFRDQKSEVQLKSVNTMYTKSKHGAIYTERPRYIMLYVR